MKDKKKVVAIIPARGGSKGLPGKNLLDVGGKPLLAYPIESARSTPLIDRVIVTTDDENIANVAKEYGAEVPFLRPKKFSGDLATTETTLQHAVCWLDEHDGYHADVVVFMICNQIFRKNEWVHQVVERLLADDSLDTVFVADITHKNFWRKVDGKYIRLASDIAYASRQVREPLFREDTGIACATRADIVRNGGRVGKNVDIVPTDDERTSIDVHSPFDYWLTQAVIAEWPIDRKI